MDRRSLQRTLITPSLFLSNVANYIPSLITSLLLVDISHAFNIDVGIAGQLRTAAFLCSIVSALIIGGLSVNYSHKGIILIGIVFLNVAALCSFLSPTFLVLLAGYALTGVSLACIRPMGSAIVGTVFSVDERPRIIGILTVGGASGYLIGSLLIGIIADWRLAFILLVLPLALLSLGLVIFGVPSTSTASRSSFFHAFRMILSNRSAIACLIGNVFAFITWSVFLSYIAAFYRQTFRLESSMVSYLFIGLSLVYIVAGVSVGRFVHRLGRKPLTVVTAVLTGIFLLASMNVASLWISLGFALVTSFMSGIRISAYNSLALEQVAEYRGTMMSLSQVSQDLGSTMGTSIGGALLILFDYGVLGILGVTSIVAAGIFHLLTLDPTN